MVDEQQLMAAHGNGFPKRGIERKSSCPAEVILLYNFRRLLSSFSSLTFTFLYISIISLLVSRH